MGNYFNTKTEEVEMKQGEVNNKEKYTENGGVMAKEMIVTSTIIKVQDKRNVEEEENKKIEWEKIDLKSSDSWQCFITKEGVKKIKKNYKGSPMSLQESGKDKEIMMIVCKDLDIKDKVSMDSLINHFDKLKEEEKQEKKEERERK